MRVGFVTSTYRMLAVAPSEYRAAASSADSVDLASAVNTVVAAGRTTANGNPTVAVSCRFADSGATCDITLIRYFSVTTGTNDPSAVTILGTDTLTATAQTYRMTASGAFVADDLLFDLAGATHYEIRAAATSSGNVTIWQWAYGSDTK